MDRSYTPDLRLAKSYRLPSMVENSRRTEEHQPNGLVEKGWWQPRLPQWVDFQAHVSLGGLFYYHPVCVMDAHKYRVYQNPHSSDSARVGLGVSCILCYVDGKSHLGAMREGPLRNEGVPYKPLRYAGISGVAGAS